ncbi:hypothetical protein D3C86_1314480 [compost metagenome]
MLPGQRQETERAFDIVRYGSDKFFVVDDLFAEVFLGLSERADGVPELGSLFRDFFLQKDILSSDVSDSHLYGIEYQQQSDDHKEDVEPDCFIEGWRHKYGERLVFVAGVKPGKLSGRKVIGTVRQRRIGNLVVFKRNPILGDRPLQPDFDILVVRISVIRTVDKQPEPSEIIF